MTHARTIQALNARHRHVDSVRWNVIDRLPGLARHHRRDGIPMLISWRDRSLTAAPARQDRRAQPRGSRNSALSRPYRRPRSRRLIRFMQLLEKEA
jgi:hypothetical protein